MLISTLLSTFVIGLQIKQSVSFCGEYPAFDQYCPFFQIAQFDSMSVLFCNHYSSGMNYHLIKFYSPDGVLTPVI